MPNDQNSVTSALMGGISTTCRRSIGSAFEASSALVQTLQKQGINASTWSGVSVIFSVVPLCPGCPPGLRPVTTRRLRFLRPKSPLGGILLLLLSLRTAICSTLFAKSDSFWPNINIWSRNPEFSDSSNGTRAPRRRSSAFSASKTAILAM